MRGKLLTETFCVDDAKSTSMGLLGGSINLRTLFANASYTLLVNYACGTVIKYSSLGFAGFLQRYTKFANIPKWKHVLTREHL